MSVVSNNSKSLQEELGDSYQASLLQAFPEEDFCDVVDITRDKPDYNSINWKEVFQLDSKSASGLSRVYPVYAPNGGVIYSADTGVGWKKYTQSGKAHCWIVSLSGKIYVAHRIIWILIHGSISSGMVIDHLDGNPFNNDIDNLALKTLRNNSQNYAQYKNNTSGIAGIYFNSITRTNGSRRSYWVAQWCDKNTKKQQKYFSVEKHGESLAKEMAISARKAAIEDLNLNGQMYTYRAGKCEQTIKGSK